MISEPGFWDRDGGRQEILKERSFLLDTVGPWQEEKKDLEELEIYLHLVEEENDAEALQELLDKFRKSEEIIAQMEFRRMLGGENDANNAIVSINAGAGGTEAQDWAEMLLRMYLRWVERRDFKTEIVDIQPGEEAGIKSATFTVEGAYAYGYLKAEIGIHRLVRISPFDANARRHTSFASVFVYPEIDDDVEVEIDEKDLDRHLPVQRAPADSTSTRPIRRCGSPISRPASSSSARTNAPSTRTRRRPLKILRAKCIRTGDEGERSQARRTRQREEGDRLGKPDQVLCDAPLPDGQGPPDERGHYTSTASWTATSTNSSGPICSMPRPSRLKGVGSGPGKTEETGRKREKRQRGFEGIGQKGQIPRERTGIGWP